MPRQRRQLNRESAVRDAKLIIIATEDTKATVAYFEALVSPRYYQHPKVQVQVLTREDTNSDPERVFDLLNGYRETYQLDEEDELWLVIDVDRWGNKKLSDVTFSSNQKGFHVAISNPAIELWFLLHLTALDNYDEPTKSELLVNQKEGTTRTRLEKEIINLVGSYSQSISFVRGHKPEN